MNTAAKLSAYGAALVLVAGGAWAVGGAAGPIDAAEAPAAEHSDTHEAAQPAGAATELPGGLASSLNGYTLVPSTTTLPTGTTQPFTFRILGPGGAPVTAFDVEHEKRLHLILVRRDTAGFQHLHPQLAADGTWWIQLGLPRAGSYRMYADFKPTGGQATTLGADLSAPGDYQPSWYPPAVESEVDGYRVRLDGDLVAGRSSKVRLTVTKDGREVTDLEPYLGAYGHLVALRGGDLAYLHVHPDESAAPGPSIDFHTEVPSPGTYRLFLDFQHGGKVRTAEFTVEAHGTAPAAPAPSGDDGHSHG
ncbi:hypothetical protein [Amycolatopsis sp. YIM 10]|uniref:hypothetical protein n=1 Tax=Amycolatopsis sp. YIM 10 TaxID=2653857 RepID=UPI0012900198|nr:hypothetical protein [Amycolatopsis sp. YIM 10]QFU86582.1 hypothetical protein YIM_06850 [Amycolatopsis sp. YIM 10]